jgi:chemotaxis signal transduction protein
VVDLGLLLGVADTSVAGGREARIVVVREAGGAKRRAGLRVDELCGLREIPDEGLSAAPGTASDRVRNVVVGVIPAAPPCSVLDVTAILDAPELAALAGRAERDAS